MADDWWQNDPVAGQSQGRVGYIPGTPKAPTPPSGYTGDSSGLHYIPGGPADPSAPGNSQSNQQLDNINGMRKQFEGEQPVQDYKTIIPLMDNAFKLGANKAGDLNLVYAFGKVMDPGSVVREGEQVMATNVGGVSEKVKGYLDQINGGAGLTPTQRTQLTEEIRNRGRALAQSYGQRRTFYEDFAKRNGINPTDVVGPHPYSPFVEDEKNYIRAHGGTPKIDGVPLDSSPKGRFGDDFGAAGTDIQFNDESGPRQLTLEQAKKDQAFLATKPTPEQYASFLEALTGGPVLHDQAAKRLDDANKGGTYSPRVKDPRVQPKVDQMLREGGTAGSAGVAGFGDAGSVGSLPRAGAAVSALSDSLQGHGSFSDNYNVDLDANRQYLDTLQHEHPYAYLGGSLAGGIALPVGAVKTPLALAKISALYGGTYGAMQGDSNTSFSARAGNTVAGALAGSATAYGLSRAGQALRRTPGAVPELVDPATGGLNQPLEAMRPGQRVQAANEFGIDLPMDAAGGRSAAIVGKGLDIMPGSAGAMEDARRATEQQVANAAGNVADRFGSSRTLSEGGAELQRGASERIERGKDVISKAYNSIPIMPDHPASSSSAVSALRELTGRFTSNPDLADAVRDPRLATYMGAIEKGGLSWKDLKDFRSLVGEKIGDMRFGEGHSTQDLRQLYGALSEDMRTTAASLGPKASRAFDRANNLNRENQGLIEGALTRILGADGKLAPEKAAAAVAAMTKGGKSTGDLKALAQIRSATVKSGAWDEIASTLIRLGGQPANSAGRDFNPQTFVNWYADMAQPARNLLFGRTELRSALDQFVAVNQRLMKVNALRNTSNTAGSMTAAGTVGVMGAALLNPMLGVKVAAMGAGNFAMAKVWTNPAFVRWATGFAKAATPAAAKSQIGRLGKLAATNPNLREPLVSLQQRLLKAANDNVTKPLAASQPDYGNENQN